MRQGVFRRAKDQSLASKRKDKRGRTAQQREDTVYYFIILYATEHMGHTPTMREIIEATGLPSTSSVTMVLDRLVKQDRLRLQDGLLVIPGSSFAWAPPPGPSHLPLSATNRSVEYRTDAGAGIPSDEGDRPLVSGG